ncbi:guanyl-specific ribonuclease [Streptomyces sparsus]
MLLACLTVCALLLAGCGTGSDRATTGPTSSAPATPSWAAGMETVTPKQLPPEARETLRLIERDGPYPYEKDGSVFGNFERRLPDRARGHYREYTVPTPGSPDRGARRIVAGREGERFYTSDHYESFQAVVQP